jgi:hypothetical protein
LGNGFRVFELERRQRGGKAHCTGRGSDLLREGPGGRRRMEVMGRSRPVRAGDWGGGGPGPTVAQWRRARSGGARGRGMERER